MVAFVQGIDRASAALNRIAIFLAVIMAVLMIGCLCAEVFFRYVLRHSLPWSEEVALLLFTWVVLLFGSIGVREAFHVRISLVVNLLPERGRIWLERLTLLAIAAFGILLLKAGWDMALRNWTQVAPATRYPLPLLYGSIPVMGALIALHACARMIRPNPFVVEDAPLE
jgi:TRAP-type C4-dicarboxylate transport system permease small subunit